MIDKKIPIELADEEEEWMNIKIDRVDNIPIEYNYIAWRIPLVVETIMLKIIWWNYKKELNFRREKK